ncbi:hypothetical protein DLAC_07001 [Tieghemostelium lacteum]|uniref:Uncharacterized protein n=1 Tax=Tieghemostelium lacteum TaxID=361077 RepID=A0A151ZE22_TIELA|nr:hypothetical protein DLAC_07001 [Tieghemostelium lacteum]|eukprot:KYQ92160.1 hypothetical protein DLAC_07001 [Tieghemostelium lacteum]
MKLTATHKLHLLIVTIQLLIYTSSCQQLLPVISFFESPSTTAPVSLLQIDLNTGEMTSSVTNVPYIVEFCSILDSTYGYVDTIYLNMTGYLNYYIGRYYFSNSSIVPLYECQNETYDYFEYLNSISYYDYEANKISMVGIPGVTNNITIITYDLNANSVQYYITDYVPVPTTLPGSSIYNENQVVSFFYNNNGVGYSPSILISDIVALTSQLYVIDEFDYLNYLTAPEPFTVYIKGQLYLMAADGDGYYYFFSVQLEDQKAVVKVLFKDEFFYCGVEPLLVTQDQQNIIFFGTSNRNDTSSLKFTNYNIQTTQSQTVIIENHNDMNPQDYAVFWAQ